MLELVLHRFASRVNHTIGVLLIACVTFAFTLEDQFREQKVRGSTRIPAGRYRITLRTEGALHDNYLKRFGSDFHKGMLWLRDVPGFEYIYIHIGNSPEHTDGCILVGQTADLYGTIARSEQAYKLVYAEVIKALAEGKEVWIDIKDHA